MKAPCLRLVGERGDVIREIEMIDLPFVIGRGAENSLVLDDPKLSRSHARVELRGEDIYLVDLESRNGCFDKDGQKFSENKLSVGKSKFRIGKTWIEIEVFDELKGEVTVVDVEFLQPPSAAAAIPDFELKKEQLPPPPPRVNLRPPPPLTIAPIDQVREIEVPHDLFDSLRNLLMNPKFARGGFLLMAAFFTILYDHGFSGLLVDTFVHMVAIAVSAGISTSLTWSFAKWFGRPHRFFSIFSFYVFAYSVGIIMTEMYGYFRFVLPEYSSVAALILSASSLISFVIFLLNLRIIFDARKLIFRSLVGLFMSVWFLGTGAKVMKDPVRWRSISQLESFKSTPYRYPASIEVNTQRFLKELNESLEVFEEKSQKSFLKSD
jgi:hypothetical protein